MVIDLDAPVPAAETPSRGPRLTDLVAARPVAVLAVALVVLALGGSAAPPAGLRRVLAVQNTSGAFALTSSALFTADLGRAPGRQATIHRHSLDGPSPPWSIELPQTAGSLDFAGPAQVLVVAPAEVLLTTSVDYLQTTFLDSETGAVLWRTTTDRVVRLAETSALMTGGTTDSAVLWRADLRTGRTLWTRQLGSSGYLDAGDPATGPAGLIVSVDQQGHATVLGYADGAVLATADLSVAPSRTDDGPGDTATYAVVGDRLYLARRDDDEASLTAYRLPDLQQIWRNTTALIGRPTWCGPDHLCVATAEGLTVLDGDTGTTRWSDNRWRVGVDTRAIGIPGPPRIAVAGGRPDTDRALLDPGTGTTLSLLGTSTFVGTRLLRSDLNEPGRTWIQEARSQYGIRTLGSVDNVAPSRCAAVQNYIACPTNSGLVGVWRVPT